MKQIDHSALYLVKAVCMRHARLLIKLIFDLKPLNVSFVHLSDPHKAFSHWSPTMPGVPQHHNRKRLVPKGYRLLRLCDDGFSQAQDLFVYR